MYAELIGNNKNYSLNGYKLTKLNQLPFTSINYGTCTLTEGRYILKAILQGSINGVGKYHLTPIFPCGIFQCMKGVNRHPGDPNYDIFKLALESTSKRIYPNYVNVDWSVNEGYDKNDPRTYTATMGCHSAGTKIIMADGTKKNVEDVVVGDKLMGVNGETRTVQSLIKGRGPMFRVKQSRAESYVVNEYHILALQYVGDGHFNGVTNGGKLNITLHDYLQLSSFERELLHGYKDGTEDTSELTIEELPEDNFYGFELDGDKLYLINDNTVTHNCRTYNGYDINGLGQIKDGRGNLAPVTIILPTLAMELKQNLKEGDDIVKKFMSVLDKKIFEAKDMLLERYEILCKQSPKSASFMWENNTMYGYIPEEGIQSALKHGTLAIGQIALAETLQILIGKDQTTDEGMELAKKIEGLFQKRCKEFKEEYKLNFGVYYTPAENLCYTAFTKFKNTFGEVDNVTNIIKVDEDGTITKTPKSFFTNSIHVPVWKELTPFEKIDIESQLTNYSNSGCITYVELPSGTSNNIEALETIVNYAMDKDIPYFAINIPLDSCDDCGYQGEVNDTCPECGSHNISQLRRVTGYLTGNYKCSFNLGKQDETENRVKHMRSI